MLDISDQEMRNSYADLTMIKSFSMTPQLRKNRAELDPHEAFQIDDMVFIFSYLKLRDQAQYLQVQDGCFKKNR